MTTAPTRTIARSVRRVKAWMPIPLTGCWPEPNRPTPNRAKRAQRDRCLVRLFAFAGGLVAFASLFGGCYRKMSVSMERIGAQYVMRFKTGGQDTAVKALFVSTLEDGKSTGNICEWGAQLPVHPVVGKWIYGDSLPAEYESKGCRPLSAGLYRVQALGFGAGGILDVRLDQAGNVQPL